LAITIPVIAKAATATTFSAALIQTEARLGEKVVQVEGGDDSARPIPAALFPVVDTNTMTIM
jgi:hypothetical protein